MRYLALLSVLLSAVSLSANELYKQLSNDVVTISQETLDTSFRLTYEVIPLANAENMGVVGTHYDIFTSDEKNPLYGGFGFFSALSGEDGGFFTFGYTLGIAHQFSNSYKVDAGVYAGGGAGKYIGFDNGGLMLRSHIALAYHFGSVDMRLGVSRTSFPNTRSNK